MYFLVQSHVNPFGIHQTLTVLEMKMNEERGILFQLQDPELLLLLLLIDLVKKLLPALEEQLL